MLRSARSIRLFAPLVKKPASGILGGN